MELTVKLLWAHPLYYKISPFETSSSAISAKLLVYELQGTLDRPSVCRMDHQQVG